MSSLDLNPELPATTRTSGSRETLEDYTLRYAPLSFRRWGPGVVAVTALGGIAYLADFSIGASIGMAWGTSNAIYSILVAALVIFLTGIPLAITAARYNIDLDLITRSAGFGYFGSVITSIIFVRLHLYLLRPRRLDHGPGAAGGPRDPAVGGVSDRHPDGAPAGGLWHESPDPPAGMDHPAVAGADGGAGGVADCQRSAAGGRLPAFRR
ncbi:membrane hypothetical protein [Klebsiella variicola]|nr:membrane hypothetical protein [Klebsiella variicola]